LLASSNPGNVVLDPFFGTGTTGAMAKLLRRHWIGIEKDPKYIEIAEERIAALTLDMIDPAIFKVKPSKYKEKRIPFGNLLDAGLIKPGQPLYFRGERDMIARVKSNGHLVYNGFEGSIHQVSRMLTGGSPINGWEYWFYEDQEGNLTSINILREHLRKVSYPD
jgi:hypothetical protein